MGNGGELAVGAEGPAVVGADECAGVAVVGAAQAVAAVAADVQEGVYLALPVAGDQHRVLPHVGGEEVAWLGDLGLVAQEQPAAGEDLLQFFLVYVLSAEDAGAYETAIEVDQLVGVCENHALLLPPGVCSCCDVSLAGLYYKLMAKISEGTKKLCQNCHALDLNSRIHSLGDWIPAFAGMTGGCGDGGSAGMTRVLRLTALSIARISPSP